MNLLKTVLNSMPLFSSVVGYIRVVQLRMNGVTVTGGARSYNSKLEPTVSLAEQSHIESSSIGARTAIGRWTTVLDSTIGRYCSISWNVSIGARNHPTQTVSSCAFFFHPKFGIVDRDTRVFKQTTIGHDTWIGAGAVIMPGVSVGVGCIVGSNAVVTKDIPPYSIAVGIPAKVIRSRFDEEIVSLLLESQWWLLPEDTLRANGTHFCQELNREDAVKFKEFCQSNL